jgi:hypothetical protein
LQGTAEPFRSKLVKKSSGWGNSGSTELLIDRLKRDLSAWRLFRKMPISKTLWLMGENQFQSKGIPIIISAG